MSEGISVENAKGFAEMSKIKLITATQMKKALQGYSQPELIALIAEITKSSPQAHEFLTVRLSPNASAASFLEKYMAKIEHEFYPKRGLGRLNLREAKKAVTDFRKICSDKSMGVDIMLFYVENCVKFTNDFGDMDESFYNGACSMFGSAVKEIISCGKYVYSSFADRLKAIVDNAIRGHGFKDEMEAVYFELPWVHDDDD